VFLVHQNIALQGLEDNGLIYILTEVQDGPSCPGAVQLVKGAVPL
jgi:hypothetical protein